MTAEMGFLSFYFLKMLKIEKVSLSSLSLVFESLMPCLLLYIYFLAYSAYFSA